MSTQDVQLFSLDDDSFEGRAGHLMQIQNLDDAVWETMINHSKGIRDMAADVLENARHGVWTDVALHTYFDGVSDSPLMAVRVRVLRVADLVAAYDAAAVATKQDPEPVKG